MIHIIKKDLLLVKKNLLFSVITAIAVPIIFSFIEPRILGFIALLYSVMMTEFLIIGSALTEEEKYPNAEMLLFASSYKKTEFFMDKYVLIFLVFICCCLEYNAVALIFSNIPLLDFKTMLFVLLINVMFLGFFMPLQYKFGIQRTIIIVSFGVFAIPPILGTINNNVSFHNTISAVLSEIVQYGLLILAIGIATFLSAMISCKIYMRKEF